MRLRSRSSVRIDMRLGLLVVFVACKDAPPKPTEPHWTSRQVVKVTGTTKSGTTFTIQMPADMRAKPRGKTGIDYVLNEKRTGIRFVISEGCVEDTLEDMAATHADDTKWIRRDKLPAGGFIASYENPTYIDNPDDLIVKVCHASIDMTCFAELTPWHSGDRVRDALPKAEEMCLSLGEAPE